MKGENKLEGASNYKAWEKRIDIILEKNKVLDLVKGKVKNPTNESSATENETFKETKILAMTLMVDGIKDNVIPYISNIDSTQDMYEALSKLFTIKNLGKIESLKNKLRTMKMKNEDTMASLFVRIARIRDELQAIDETAHENELVITALL